MPQNVVTTSGHEVASPAKSEDFSHYYIFCTDTTLVLCSNRKTGAQNINK